MFDLWTRFPFVRLHKGTGRCTSATVVEAGLGERHLGQGVIRIAGEMFPDPNYMPGGVRDMRFGVAS